jgi:Zn-dependent peptidase ImmA (M78 family)/transcriptional regulator with XRE-family HTH domain
MAARVPALIEPALLIWARERASLSQEEVASKIDTEVEKLNEWENGAEQISIAQLKKLAELYKRPISVFFLPEPPKDFQALRDLRRLHAVRSRVSKSLAYEVRTAHERRLIALELAEVIGEPPVDFGIRAEKTDNPETVAELVRERLGVSVQMQARWNNHDQTFRGWRDAIERVDILVTVLSGAHHQVPLSEVRGFAIAERPYPMIVVNGQDRGYGRVFTMLHELAHIILGESVLEDDLEPNDMLPSANRATEIFCNKLAAAILMPRDNLLAEHLTAGRNTDGVYSDAEIAALSTRYGVSREAMLVRLSDIGRANPQFVQAKRAQLAALYAAQKKKEEEDDEDEGGGFAPYQYQVLGHLGRGYARLVLQAYNARHLTLSTASGYLGTQAKLVPKIERAAFSGATSQ